MIRSVQQQELDALDHPTIDHHSRTEGRLSTDRLSVVGSFLHFPDRTSLERPLGSPLPSRLIRVPPPVGPNTAIRAPAKRHLKT